MKFWNASRTSRRKAGARTRSVHPCLESLEDRCVPSASFDSVLGVGSAGYDAAFATATDRSGNVYMSGYFSGTVDFDPGSTHPGNTDILSAGSNDRDIFVAKYAPDGSFLWASPMTGTTDSSGDGRSLALDGSGNVYLGGYFSGTIAFGSSNLTSAGTKDGFAAKLDSGGNVLWATNWSDGTNTYPQSVAVDSGGNLFTAEYAFNILADGSNGPSSAVVRKFNPTGTTLWVDQVGPGTGKAEGMGIATDTAGNAYLCGGFAGTVDFDPGPGTYNVKGGAAAENGYVLKLTAAGKFAWVSTFIGQTSGSTTGQSVCNALALDGSGNIVVGGHYSGSVDFDPGKHTRLLPNVSSGGFVTTLSSTGSLVWADQVGTNTSVQALALDLAGNVYVTGVLQGTSVFAGTSTTLTSNGKTDVFVAKLNASGSLVWAESFGGSDLDWGYGIAVDTAGNIYVAGYYGNTVNFDPDPNGTPYYLTSAGMSDLFLLELRQD